MREQDEKRRLLDSLPGVQELIRRRGDEEVPFRHVADHLVDFAARDVTARDVVDRLAAFLAQVEAAPHDHDVTAGSKGG